MKAIFSLTALAAIIFSVITALSPDLPYLPKMEAPIEERLPDAYRNLLPVETAIPDRLPRGIEDPFLLAAWVHLYNQTAPIQVQDGYTVSGRVLAEYVLANDIEIQWSSDEICRGNSCSQQPVCPDATCVANFKRKAHLPIYISPRYREYTPEMLVKLSGSLGHELYHYQLPFGPVKSSLFEEYWAYYIGSQIKGNGWGNYEDYDPYNAACLQAWFKDHNVPGYTNADVYPFTLESAIDWDSACGNP